MLVEVMPWLSATAALTQRCLRTALSWGRNLVLVQAAKAEQAMTRTHDAAAGKPAVRGVHEVQ